MRFTAEFLDELRNRLTLSDVVGRQVKLTRKGREFGGLCPFHNEKTPSFTVNDQKEFYHCFGCGSHGGAIDFVMGTQGLEFPEAVEQLAREAGMELPEYSPYEAEKTKERASLHEVMEAVTLWYSEQLKTQSGSQAYRYLDQTRRLLPETIMKFRLGFAPDGRDSLKRAMLARNISEQQLIDTGMLIRPDNGRDSYDRFRNRLMFPITDKKGRVIAFGGRALSSEVKAKYLNSPETSLFHKGHTLYNYVNARKAAYETGNLVVVEGYMDVIALDQQGIEYAVAPLGTAVTEDQMNLMWKMSDEPILCFDGDNAGQRASIRASERSLPILKPGKSLRFVHLPQGEDPDTLVRKEGRKIFESLLDSAAPLVEILWKDITGQADIKTPERRAGLEKKGFSLLASIEDENVKKLYMSEFGSRFRNLFWHAQRMTGGGKGFNKQQKGAGLATTTIGRKMNKEANFEKIELLLLKTILQHPALLVVHLEDFADIDFLDPELTKLQQAILDFAHYGKALDFERLVSHLESEGLAPEMKRILIQATDDWFSGPEAALADAETGFLHVLARYQRIGPALEDFKRAEESFQNDMTETNQERFFAAKKAFEEIMGTEATIDYYGIASNRKNLL